MRGGFFVSIREKIEARESEIREKDILGKAMRRAFTMIMCGYLGGTIIGLILRRLING